MPHGMFVPNDTRLGPDAGLVLLITGPNMAGKSTYIRQVALLAVLAQMGSFVPAKSARLGVVDRLFARVGATDELGYYATENPVHVHDLHATMLKLLGIDHKRLTYRYQGRDFRLTDVAGNVVREVLA